MSAVVARPREAAQAGWARQRIQQWIGEGVAPHEIAVLSRQWEQLGPVRVLLESSGVKTQALKSDRHALVRNLVTSRLIEALSANRARIIYSDSTVYALVCDLITQLGHSASEPTVKTLLKIAQDLDRERGLGDEEMALAVTYDDVLTSVFEFNASADTVRDEEAVLVTTCHSAKGLEFRNVILLTDGFATTGQSEAEQERRLFYVAMTRAKNELDLCGVSMNTLLDETGLVIRLASAPAGDLPSYMQYLDLTPEHIWLSNPSTIGQQHVIRGLREGMPLNLIPNRFGNGWDVTTESGIRMGALSRQANQQLSCQGMEPARFQFSPGEVTVRNIYQHIETDSVTGVVTQEHFVVLPQIRVVR